MFDKFDHSDSTRIRRKNGEIFFPECVATPQNYLMYERPSAAQGNSGPTHNNPHSPSGNSLKSCRYEENL